jgi:putative ABC transport system permease protein
VNCLWIPALQFWNALFTIHHLPFADARRKEDEMGTLIQDARYGIRMLARNPGFTAVAVLTLALGIGVNTAIFSVINAVLLRPLPFHDPDRLVQLWESEYGSGRYELTGRDYLEWQAQTQSLEETSLYRYWPSFNASGAGEPEQARAIKTQANFFSLLGVAPLLGRTFQRGEDQAGQDHVMLLSHGFWERHFGGSKQAVGTSLELDNEKYIVVGVLPAWFRFRYEPDVWIPLDMSPQKIGGSGMHEYRAMGRMKRGVSVAEARTEMQAIAQRLAKQYPESNSHVGAVVIPLKDELTGGQRTQLLVLLGAVFLVLLIACTNVANLLLARATGRQREIALRSALGADRPRIIRQLLTESVLLSLCGGVFGLALAWWCVRLLATMKTVPIPQPNPLGLDGTVLLFTFGISLLVGILFGLAPALQVSHLRLSEELKASAQAIVSPSGRRRILRHGLVVGEIAVSLVLLIGAGLLLRSLAKMREVSVGAQPEKVLTMNIALPPQRYSTLEQRTAFFQQLLESVKNTPGAQEASASAAIPLEHYGNGYIRVDGQANPALDRTLVEFNYVSTGYFRTFGIPFFQGRNFTEQEYRDTEDTTRKVAALWESGHPEAARSLRQVAVINQTMARHFWPQQNPLGKTFRMGDNGQFAVLGVVADVNERGVRRAVLPQVYVPLPGVLDEPGPPITLAIRSAGEVKTIVPAVREKARRLDASLAVSQVRTMEEVISDSIDMAGTSYQTLLFGLFGMLALILTAVGIYGVMAYAVSQRRHEIGIRIALGAQRRSVLALVIGQGARLTLAGLAIGMAGTYALAGLMSSLVYGISTTDPLTLAAVSALLAAVALLACYLPARRATKVDPMVALRYE